MAEGHSWASGDGLPAAAQPASTPVPVAVQRGETVELVFPVQVEVRATAQAVDIGAIADEVLTKLASALPGSG